MPKPIRVLIVDDSVLVREAARQALSGQPGVEVMDTAMDPLYAMEKMAREWPDVIVLDIQMPRMDGISFLKKIMAERPTPVVICSSLVGNGAQIGVEALRAGAVSLISKPKAGVSAFFENESDNLVAAVRAASHTNLARLRQIATTLRPIPPLVKPARPGTLSADGRVIAIGSSTGGTQALETVLGALGTDLPGMVIVQHMPLGFSKKFADRLNQDIRIELCEAQHGQRVEPGLALLAEAGKQMRLQKSGSGYIVEVVEGPIINRHRPSVDCLFSSVAKVAGPRALGLIMTGMGDDGALGMKEMFDCGAHTIAESEETCVVFGMPRVAIARGGVREVQPLHKIAERVRAWVG
ncbi:MULTISPECIES: chemotaxis response regulator protein-glutamate methylesterase [unclassified Uliginosibacterium]|uniref:protein-glutamate methylesterase/protein-glutamine glutaminase n=1 Tax=unclassified Uliginosibacterium TaxID=2621521 RepID=UPI000C7CF5FD|nr:MULTISPECIES: chemotaxis response regulator protein-glutamate methylesterase [unclassified Uliginosibacterium]MDO6386631.1 chemotaxis response regulator protein-glutamate methylesterase [Uliginosibacterium sp. 31-12]PLK50465.1 chemotaxis response regulator protein-glutamate methylesterase [Uliginosibacterium sp. TH139]